METEEDEAARPILGHHLLATARRSSQQKLKPASSGSAVIDEKTLEGLFRYGEITSIAGASGTGKTLVLQSNLVLAYMISWVSVDRLPCYRKSPSFISKWFGSFGRYDRIVLAGEIAGRTNIQT